MSKRKEQDERMTLGLKERAYQAMFNAEQKHGHGSPAHRIAWTVFAETGSIARGETFPYAFANNQERSTALSLVEASCRKGGGSPEVKAAIKEIAAKPRMM